MKENKEEWRNSLMKKSLDIVVEGKDRKELVLLEKTIVDMEKIPEEIEFCNQRQLHLEGKPWDGCLCCVDRRNLGLT